MASPRSSNFHRPFRTRARSSFGHTNMAHAGTSSAFVISVFLTGPVRQFNLAHPLKQTGTLALGVTQAEELVGLEIKGGVIRADPEGVRVRHRNDYRSRKEAESASTNGARSHRQCVASAAQDGGKAAVEAGGGGRVH